MDEKKLFSICIPIYKNENNLPVTIPYIIEHLYLFEKYRVEIVMVNDGSPDKSYEVMKKYKKEYPELIRIATLTRNFGQGACIHACMEIAKGDVIGVISADMQDPFELFVDMLVEWENGYKLVLATREKRQDKGISKFFSGALHKFINKFIDSSYPKGGFDFQIMDKEVVEKFLKLDRTNALGQVRLLWLGYRYKTINYVRREREIGHSGWKFKKKVSVAFSVITSYLPLPIHIILGIGAAISIIFFLLTIVFLVMMLMGAIDNIQIGLLLVVILGIGINMFTTGLIGEYLWCQFEIVKDLPRYVIDED
jgi:dolichol-phosphate mannosyltransferase